LTVDLRVGSKVKGGETPPEIAGWRAASQFLADHVANSRELPRAPGRPGRSSLASQLQSFSEIFVEGLDFAA
jgi:hypothetical protein